MTEFTPTEVPLIWTIRGNVPASLLRYEHQWTDTAGEVTFEERWYFDDGVLAKNNCHMLAKRQLTIGGEQAAMA